MPSREPVDIIVPTMDNIKQLLDCVWSISLARCEYHVRFIIVNNGEGQVRPFMPDWMQELCLFVEPGKNLGWTGGLREGLKHSQSKYVVFANDDIYLPRSSSRWLKNMIRMMDLYPQIGAMGPSSNVVTGMQNIWAQLPAAEYVVKFLIGFCMVLRREALEKAGGIHDMEHGGDDFDLSIRLRKAGYLLACRRDEFVYHHGFQTGERVHGRPDKPGGWNSREMVDAVNMELIRKHGFGEWWETVTAGADEDPISLPESDAEAIVIQAHCNGGRVVELGCGAVKTVTNAIGVDIIPKGQMIPYMNKCSIADITADVQEPLPFEECSVDTVIARHVLEHCLDPVVVLRQWGRVIKPGGRLIVACPDEYIRDGIPLNPQHCHAFTPESLQELSSLVGYKTVFVEQGFNIHSFVSVLEKQ